MPEQMSDDEKWVRERWRDGSIWRSGSWRDGESFWKVYPSRFPGTDEPLGYGSSPEEAWSDARQRIEAASAKVDPFDAMDEALMMDPDTVAAMRVTYASAVSLPELSDTGKQFAISGLCEREEQLRTSLTREAELRAQLNRATTDAVIAEASLAAQAERLKQAEELLREVAPVIDSIGPNEHAMRLNAFLAQTK